MDNLIIVYFVAMLVVSAILTFKFNNPKTKKCPYCHMQVDPKARVCPYCRRSIGTHAEYGLTFLVTFVVLNLIALIIFGGIATIIFK